LGDHGATVDAAATKDGLVAINRAFRFQTCVFSGAGKKGGSEIESTFSHAPG
jgi:hypothetical protein